MARQRLDLREAAEILGTTVDAVRKRVQRGSLDSEKGEDGRVYVWLDGDLDGVPPHESNALISEMRDWIQSLERRLDEEMDANREMRRIVAALTQRIPELPAPQEPPGDPESVVEEPERAEPRSGAGGPQEATERQFTEVEQEEPRSWWRRVFGG